MSYAESASDPFEAKPQDLVFVFEFVHCNFRTEHAHHLPHSWQRYVVILLTFRLGDLYLCFPDFSLHLLQEPWSVEARRIVQLFRLVESD